jgi:transposase
MTLPEPELQPTPPSAPRPTPRSADAEPERLSASPPPVDSSQRPQPQPRQPLDPGAVAIAAPKPEMPIVKGLPGPGLLAHLIVSKCVDHLPLHRMERAYQRQGLFLHRSTLCDWITACANLLRPLYDLMVSVVMQSQSSHTDDTTVKMQELVTHILSRS